MRETTTRETIDSVPDIETDTVDARTLALDLRHPGVPATLNDLAALRHEAIEVVQARITVLSTLRREAIRLTHPEDWLLFKSPDQIGRAHV